MKLSQILKLNSSKSFRDKTRQKPLKDIQKSGVIVCQYETLLVIYHSLIDEVSKYRIDVNSVYWTYGVANCILSFLSSYLWLQRTVWIFKHMELIERQGICFSSTAWLQDSVRLLKILLPLLLLVRCLFSCFTSLLFDFMHPLKWISSASKALINPCSESLCLCKRA